MEKKSCVLEKLQYQLQHFKIISKFRKRLVTFEDEITEYDSIVVALHPLYMCCQYTARIVHYGFYCICCCLFTVKENVTPIFTLCVRQKRSPGNAYLLSEDFASLVAVCGQILSAH